MSEFLCACFDEFGGVLWRGVYGGSGGLESDGGVESFKSVGVGPEICWTWTAEDESLLCSDALLVAGDFVDRLEGCIDVWGEYELTREKEDWTDWQRVV